MIVGWAWLAACAARAPRYDPVDFALTAHPAEVVRATADLDRWAGGRHLRACAPALDTLPAEVCFAIWATSLRAYRGAELDLWVDVGAGPRAVTLWWSAQREVRAAWSEAEPAPAAVSYADFQWEGPWGPEEAEAVGAGLATLSDAELALVADLTLWRGARSDRAPRRELAFFDPAFEPPEIRFFDIAFDPAGFVGEPDAPGTPAAMTALHEVGHAIADLPFRRAYLAYLAAHERWERTGDPGDRAADREAWRRYRALGRAGPVVSAWEAFRGRRRGPTPYGWRDPYESFAEAFALAHLDPAALDRALPGAVAWFAAHPHVDAAAAAR
ncbi:MAG: hypothetical protein R3F59_15820 [Myxococcota bacterium]